MSHRVSQDKLYTNRLRVTQNYHLYYCATLANSSNIPHKKSWKPWITLILTLACSKKIAKEVYDICFENIKWSPNCSLTNCSLTEIPVFVFFVVKNAFFFTQILWIFFWKFWYDSTRKNFEVDNLRRGGNSKLISTQFCTVSFYYINSGSFVHGKTWTEKCC